MKRKILVFMLFAVFFLLASCEMSTSSTTTIYSITYYNYDNEVLTLEPSTYEKGTTTVLPTLEAVDGHAFLGWKRLGEDKLIFTLTSTTRGNVVLYASFQGLPEEVEAEKGNPSSLIKNTNVKVSYEINRQRYVIENDGSAYHVTNNTGDLYISQDQDDVIYVYYKDGAHYVEEEVSEEAALRLAKEYCPLDLSALNTNFYLEQGDSETIYYLDGDEASAVTSHLFGVTMSFKRLEVLVSNNVITKIVASLASGTKIEVLISDFNGEIEIPYVAPLENSYIKQAKAAKDGTKFTVKGYVTGIVGFNFFISDGHEGLYIYTNSSNWRDIVTYGDAFEISGTVASYHGLKELKSITSITKLDVEVSPTTTELIGLSEVQTYLNLPINISDINILTKPNLPSNFGTGSVDATITLSDGTRTYKLFFSKSLKTAVKQALVNALSGFKSNTPIILQNVIVNYDDEYEIMFTENSKLIDATTYERGLHATSVNVSLPIGSSIDDLLNKTTIYLQEVDGTRTQVAKDDLIFSGFDTTTAQNIDVTVSYLEFVCHINVRVFDDVEIYQPTDVEVLDDVLPRMYEYDGVVYGLTGGLPNTGEPKILVIPVTFTDYDAPEGMKERLEKAFFGTSEDTGWESLQSYYYKSSFGKLNITGTVLDPFPTNQSSGYYEKLGSEDAAVCQIIKAALEYYDATIDYSEYDTDNDGYIDGLYLVYTAPVNYKSNDSLYWAFTYEYFTSDVEYYDNVEADYYCFFGYDFLDEELANGTTPTINTETIIHESGHMLGLDDYYDYDDSKGPKGGLGGADMMDYNIGDHNTYSKAILGWVNPYVVNGYDITIDLGKAVETGQSIIVTNTWNNTYFDEYLLIEYYTPTGLNELEAGFSGQFSISGVKIYHIAAGLDEAKNVDDQWSVTKNNNSDTKNKMIAYIEADNNNSIESSLEAHNGDLFGAGSDLTFATWYDGSAANIYIEILEIGETAKIRITFE